MRRGQFRYHPDEWAHDLDQWWVPLAGLTAYADCRSDAWLNVLGVEEFFDHRVLEQTRILTPWICLAATAVAASAARDYAEAGPEEDSEADSEATTGTLAAVAFQLAAALEALRWRGQKIGQGPISTRELIDAGRAALVANGHMSLSASEPVGVCLAAGWLVHSYGETPPLIWTAPMLPAVHNHGIALPGRVIAQIAEAMEPDALTWGTAHLAERLLEGGALDRQPDQLQPDDPPSKAETRILLTHGRGQVGLFEARRQRSHLQLPAGAVVPDLARMAFLHGNADMLESVAAASAAAGKVEPLERAGELISWSIQIPDTVHPLAERTVSGRSAGLGAYVTFRSLSNPGVFTDKDVAFTGQVFPSSDVGEVHGASDKIEAARHHGIRLIVHPKGQAWRDPRITVQLEGVESGEDALIAAAPLLRGLRSYLNAACRMVAPEPWLRTWLGKQGRHGNDVPLLTVMCRHLPPGRDGMDHYSSAPVSSAGLGIPPNRGGQEEPDVPPCPAHLVARIYPRFSFTISADAGGGSTTAAKRMVADAARHALDGLRALGGDEQTPGFTLPLYLPLGDLPTSWDDLVRASVAALPGLDEPGLEIAAAVANVLQSETARAWTALVVVDGTDRPRRRSSDFPGDEEADFVAMVAGKRHHGNLGWRPRLPPQIVLCGRNGSPAHYRVVEALRRERPESTVTMGLDPLSAHEIDRYVGSLATMPTSLTGKARELATNPLFLALSVIAGRQHGGDGDATDLLDRVIDVLLGGEVTQRRFLAEIAFRAAAAKREPVGEFTLTDISTPESAPAVELALAEHDNERAIAIALDREDRRSFHSAEQETHLLTASGSGWRFFHDRVFSFLVADRIAQRAIEERGSDDDHFGMLGIHLGDPLWIDVIEATGRLLELRGRALAAPP